MDNKRPINLSTLGGIPPQNLEAEAIVLGCIIFESCIARIAHILKPEMFYKPANEVIYAAAMNLWKRNVKTDIEIIRNELRETGKLDEAGGVFALTDLSSRVFSTSNLERYAFEVMVAYTARQGIKIGAELVDKLFTNEGNPIEQMDLASVELNRLKSPLSASAQIHVGESAQMVLEQADKAAEFTLSGKMMGITSGLPKLDRITGGWQKTDLIIVAARPAMGKTALGVTFAINSAKAGHPVGFFSIEMGKVQITNRIVSQLSGVDGSRLRRGEFYHGERSMVATVVEEMKSLPIIIDDTSRIPILDLRARAFVMKDKYKIQLLVVDYLQIARATEKKGRNREQEVAEIADELKGIAKDLDMPVIALAQLSRDLDKAGGREPVMADLRESGNIENAADMIFFIHRPEKYGEQFVKYNNIEYSSEKFAWLLCEKNRQGAVGRTATNYEETLTKFSPFIESQPFSYNHHD